MSPAVEKGSSKSRICDKTDSGGGTMAFESPSQPSKGPTRAKRRAVLTIF